MLRSCIVIASIIASVSGFAEAQQNSASSQNSQKNSQQNSQPKQYGEQTSTNKQSVDNTNRDGGSSKRHNRYSDGTVISR